MEESRGSREALYFQGIFVDASVNDPRVRGEESRGLDTDATGRRQPIIAPALGARIVTSNRPAKLWV
jgi:hypothetical protein